MSRRAYNAGGDTATAEPGPDGSVCLLVVRLWNSPGKGCWVIDSALLEIQRRRWTRGLFRKWNAELRMELPHRVRDKG